MKKAYRFLSISFFKKNTPNNNQNVIFHSFNFLVLFKDDLICLSEGEL